MRDELQALKTNIQQRHPLLFTVLKWQGLKEIMSWECVKFTLWFQTTKNQKYTISLSAVRMLIIIKDFTTQNSKSRQNLQFYPETSHGPFLRGGWGCLRSWKGCSGCSCCLGRGYVSGMWGIWRAQLSWAGRRGWEAAFPPPVHKRHKAAVKTGTPYREMLSTLHKRQCTRGYYCRLISPTPPRHGFCIHSQALCHAVAPQCSESQALFGLIKTLSVWAHIFIFSPALMLERNS